MSDCENDEDLSKFLEEQQAKEADELKGSGNYVEEQKFEGDADAVNTEVKKKVRKPPGRKGNSKVLNNGM